MNITYSNVYQLWYTIRLYTNEDLYIGALSIASFWCILDNELGTHTIKMETKFFAIQKCRILF